MSYLATLARPADRPARGAEPVPAPPVEPLAEVNEEVVAEPPAHASPEAGAHGVRSEDRAPSVVHDVEVIAAPSTAAVASTSRQAPPRDPLPTALAQVAAATPVVAQPRAAPAAAVALRPAIDATSTPETPAQLAPRLKDSRDGVRAPAGPVAQDALAPREPISRKTDRALVGDEPALELSPPRQPSPMTPPVRSGERADPPTVRGTPAASTRPAVNVHIGAITLTVKAPAMAAPVATPTTAPMAPPLPAPASPPRSREGLAFSASRHYLRWS